MKLLRAAQAQSRLLVRVTIEVLLRTGLRVSEFTALSADAVVQIGAAPWLHVPVGKLREDRNLPLHPRSSTRRHRGRAAAHPSPPAAAHAGHPSDQPGHVPGSDRRDARAPKHGHDPAPRQDRQPHLADEYFAVTDQVDALYAKTEPLPADAIGPKMARLRREHHRLLGNGHCTRPTELGCAFEAICENCSFFRTSIEFRPTQAQHDDAAAKGQHHRAALFDQLLTGLTEGEAS